MKNLGINTIISISYKIKNKEEEKKPKFNEKFKSEMVLNPHSKKFSRSSNTIFLKVMLPKFVIKLKKTNISSIFFNIIIKAKFTIYIIATKRIEVFKIQEQ